MPRGQLRRRRERKPEVRRGMGHCPTVLQRRQMNFNIFLKFKIFLEIDMKFKIFLEIILKITGINFPKNSLDRSFFCSDYATRPAQAPA